MSRNMQSAAAGLVAMTLALGLTGTRAQAACGTLDAPPTAMVPSTGQVVRAGHLGREIGETEPLIHFYSDLIGLKLIGPRTAPRPFFVRHGLQEFAELGEDDDVYKSTSRVAHEFRAHPELEFWSGEVLVELAGGFEVVDDDGDARAQHV